MRSHAMDRRIAIQQYSVTRSGSGHETKTWTTLATVWAEVRQKSGREYFGANQVVDEVDTLFIIRYRSDVTPKMRIVYNGRNYNIRECREIGRRDALEMMAQAEVL